MAAFHFLYYFMTMTTSSLMTNARYHHHHNHSHHHHNHNHASAPAPSPSPADDANHFDVRMYGAVGDSVTDDTEAFQTTWDMACQTDSGVLLVPDGYTFIINPTVFTGPCQKHFLFQVDGTISPPDGPESWPNNSSRRQWLVFYRADEMSLTGSGLIDGRGEDWWNLPCKPHRVANGTVVRAAASACDSPIAVRFFMSNNLTVQGIKIINSPQFHFRFDNCRNVRIDSIRIAAPALSPNTDGIHIENSNNVGIYNSVISTGDDCVSIGSGCFDVDIRNITCGPSHGISIGSLGNHNSLACASNISVRDSVVKNSDNGVRIKTWQGGYGSVSGVSFDNIYMENVRNPIIIDQFYCLGRGCENRTSAVQVSNVRYSGIKGTYDIRSPPMRFACSDSIPCMNITLSEVELLPEKGDLMWDPYCWSAYGELQTLTIPPVWCLSEGVPPGTILEKEVGYC